MKVNLIGLCLRSKAAENGWYVPQEAPQEPCHSINISSENHYGFLDAYHGYFNNVTYTENEVNELGLDTEKLGPSERRAKRVEHENLKWDEDYYMCVNAWLKLTIE